MAIYALIKPLLILSLVVPALGVLAVALVIGLVIRMRRRAR